LLVVIANADFYVETSKNSDGKYSSMQDQLMQAEAKIAKQQSDFQKLKKISISMRDDINKLTTQRSEQVGSLSRALEQCRVQLDQKQQLIATLQAQRTEFMSSGKSPFDNVPMAASYSSTAGASRMLSSTSNGGMIRRPTDYTHRPTMKVGGPGEVDIFNSGNMGRHHPSSSVVTSSSNALSGLARLIHSHGTARSSVVMASSFSSTHDDSDRYGYDSSDNGGGGEMTSSQRGMMSRVKGAKGDMNIGDGVFHSSLRHLSATVNQMASVGEEEKSDMTFRYNHGERVLQV
jgi:hypothetical protein